MKVYIIFVVLFTMLIGTSLAQNVTTGDVPQEFEPIGLKWMFSETICSD